MHKTKRLCYNKAMENDNFEQQFQQNLQASMAQPVANESSSGKLPLIISIALAAVILVESIALVITLNNYFAIMNGEEDGDAITVEEEPADNGVYVYDDNYNLTAMNITCTSENGAKFVLTNTKNYQELDSSSSQIGSGTYSIINDSLIPLSGANNNQERVLYYDGFNLADGTTLYECEENVPASTETE